jgi:hypothetical protein
LQAVPALPFAEGVPVRMQSFNGKKQAVLGVKRLEHPVKQA